jgi:hypothetical protein
LSQSRHFFRRRYFNNPNIDSRPCPRLRPHPLRVRPLRRVRAEAVEQRPVAGGVARRPAHARVVPHAQQRTGAYPTKSYKYWFTDICNLHILHFLLLLPNQ